MDSEGTALADISDRKIAQSHTGECRRVLPFHSTEKVGEDFESEKSLIGPKQAIEQKKLTDCVDYVENLKRNNNTKAVRQVPSF